MAKTKESSFITVVIIIVIVYLIGKLLGWW